jgi:hypothetical protein
MLASNERGGGVCFKLQFTHCAVALFGEGFDTPLVFYLQSLMPNLLEPIWREVGVQR